jgi:hypothetical protein
MALRVMITTLLRFAGLASGLLVWSGCGTDQTPGKAGPPGGEAAVVGTPGSAGTAMSSGGTMGAAAGGGSAGAVAAQGGELSEAGAGPDAGGIVPGPVDAIIEAMPEGSWKELPDTHMADVCPPPYSSYPCEAVMSAWSGGAYDSLRDRLVVWGGGHADSPYNNVFTFDLASMTWKRWTELPDGITGDTTPEIYQDKRVETCGLYPKVAALDIPEAWLTESGYVMPEKCDDPSIVAQLDLQQPRSAHTYGNVAFSEATGLFYALGSIGTYPSGQSRTTLVLGFDFATSKWQRGADNPITDYGASAADAQGHLWYIAGQKLHEYDPVADSWTAHAADGVGYYYAGSAVDTKHGILALTADGSSVSTYRLGTVDKTQETITPSGLSAPLEGAAGLAYSPRLDRFVAYSGGSRLALLDHDVGWTEVEGTGDVPGPRASNGTFGRFRYSPARNVFVVVSSTTQNVFIWKPPSVAP